ncbi:hypothetical protein HYW75_04175 [Candidatus Pacearchaeota archaeon]|nr:hypothetical protein [Candidatus Pacearchaeota archaeon]
MLPRWHILFGALFTFIIWLYAPETAILNLGLIFFASFIIDLDHYICGAMRTHSFHFGKIFYYHNEMGIKQHKEREKGIRKRGDFHFFHTIEFHILIAILSFFSISFFYFFIGMAFHSLLDLFWLLRHDFLYRREYFFFNWLRKRV